MPDPEVSRARGCSRCAVTGSTALDTDFNWGLIIRLAMSFGLACSRSSIAHASSDYDKARFGMEVLRASRARRT